MKLKSYLLAMLASVFILGTLTNVAAPFIKLRNIEPAPGEDYTITTNVSGTPLWIANVNGAINVDLTPIAFVPPTFGNTTNLNEVVTDPNGDVWIIDEAGDAVKTGGGGGGGGSPSYSTVTISASGETSMFVRYSGTTAPSLSETSVGQYTLTIPANTILLGFHWTANGVDHTTGSNTTELTITTTNSEILYANYTVISASTGSEFGQQQGITIKQTSPAAGQTKAVFPNMSNFGATGFIIVGKPV